MEYKYPALFFLGVVLALFWSLDFWQIFRRAQLVFPFSAIKKRKILPVMRIATWIMGLLAWGLISYSLTLPRKALTVIPAKIKVNDIFFVVDVSRSMLAEDFYPNRLEVAKQKIKDFVKQRPTDRIGIVMFSERAFTLLPLTTDMDLIEKIIADINVGFLGSGTAIGDALGLAVARGVKSEAENKVIILLTDGVSNAGSLSPMQAAEMSKDEGIKTYTIAVGGDQNARLRGYRSIPGGSIDFKVLKQISDLTGGKSYSAANEEALSEVFDEIQQLEKSEIESQSQVVYEELFARYLLWGVLLLLFVELKRRFILKEVL